MYSAEVFLRFCHKLMIQTAHLKAEEVALKKEDVTEEGLIDPLADVDAGFNVKQEEVDTSIHHLLDIKLECADA